MRAEQFIKDHGLERAREVVNSIPVPVVNFYILDIDTFLELPEGCNPYPYLDSKYKVYVSVAELQRLVESVDLVNKFGGLEAAKRKVKMALFNGFLLISFPVESGIGSIYTHKVELAIADYESIYGEGNAL